VIPKFQTKTRKAFQKRARKRISNYELDNEKSMYSLKDQLANLLVDRSKVDVCYGRHIGIEILQASTSTLAAVVTPTAATNATH